MAVVNREYNSQGRDLDLRMENMEFQTQIRMVALSYDS